MATLKEEFEGACIKLGLPTPLEPSFAEASRALLRLPPHANYGSIENIRRIIAMARARDA